MRPASRPEGGATSAETAFCEGVLAQVAGDPLHAEACYRRVLTLEPDHQGAHHHLAIALDAQGRGEEAVAVLQAALLCFSDAALMWLTLGTVLDRLTRHREAVAAFEKALACRPHDPEAEQRLAIALHNLGAALLALDRGEDGLRQFERAVALEPKAADRHHRLGLVLAELGRLDEAVAAFDRAIAIEPETSRFYRARGMFGFLDGQLAALEAMALDQAGRSVEERIELQFALGRAYADRGRPADAIRRWCFGNALKRRSTPYDEARTLDRFARIRRAFGADLIQRFSGCGHPSNRPILIVGMPRSGSTLVEQMLASHPAIFGAGEVYDLPELVGSLATAMPFPAFAGAMTATDFRALGADYDRRLARRAPAPLRVTDKMLSNFKFLGLIHLALPQARIIHVERDPVDTCLSCFAILFAREQGYSYDLAELGRYWRAYRGMMAHWRAVLPEGTLLDVAYEALVADPETETRRILAHLGLDWDESCLEFHRTRRPVRTASLVEARQPIYRSSVGRSAPYLPYLQPLLDALGLPPGH
jgi:tetratricopeptide (TPR) repeat protein